MDANHKIAICWKCHRAYAMDKFKPMSGCKKPFQCLNEECDGLAFIQDHIYKMEPDHQSRTYYKGSLWYRLKSWVTNILGIKESIGTAPKFTESKIIYEYKLEKDGYIACKLEAKN